DRSGLRCGEASGHPARIQHLLRPLLTSASRSGNLAVPSVHRDTMQISRGKLDRLHRTPAESTALALVELDFADSGLLVRPGLPRIRFLSVRSRLCVRASFRRLLAAAALAPR